MGSQLLQTVPSPLLTGASTASLSIWVRLNGHADLSRSGGVRLFGDAGGKLSVGLSASGQLQVSWSANDGAAGHTSSWGQALIPGVNYHVAATWKDGAQQYYLNGLLVGADTQRGALGTLGDAAPQPFRLGSDVAGVDVTLDEPTLWVGYALTAADVGNLRDRVAVPSAISPAAIALRWSLAGPDGGAATPGGAGLVDGSASHLDLSSVVGTPPSYQSGHLGYSLLDQGCSAMVTPSGEGIVFKFHDAATNPVNVTNVVDNDEQQTITLSGNPAGGAFTLSLGGRTTAPIPAIPADPYASFRWVKALAAGTYDLAVNIPRGGTGDPLVSYQIFDGPTLVGSATLNHSGDGGAAGGPVNPAPFSDTSTPPLQQDGGVRGNGVTISWYPLGRFTLHAGRLSVLVSGSAAFADHNLLTVDNLRIATADGAAVQLVSSKAPPGIALPNANYFGQFSGYQVYPEADGTNMLLGIATGTATRYLADAKAVQAALQSLSSIGAGNITVTGDGSVQTPLLVKFVGTLSDAAHPLLAASDPAISVGRVASGGILPSITINGGSPIPLPRSWIYYNSITPIMPTVEFFFPQAPPAVKYSVVFQYENTLENNSDGAWDLAGAYGYATGYTGQTQATRGSTPTATYRYRPVTTGQYRVSATWPRNASLTTNAIYTVYDGALNVLGAFHTDQTIAPSGAVDQGVPWQVLGTFNLTGDGNALYVVQSNGTAAPMVSDALRFERLSSDSSIGIRPGDVVAYSAGAAWATCQAGGAPKASNAPVVNLSGGQLYPPLPSTSSMEMGYNLPSHETQIGSFYYTNLMAASTLAGHPTNLGNQFQVIVPVNQTPISFGADRKNWANIPPGDYDLWWDGAADLTVTTQSGSCVESGPPAITHAANNRRRYTLGGGATCYGPQVNVIFHGVAAGDGTYTTDVTNVRLYPAGTDVKNPPYFRADFLAREAGNQSRRYLDPLGAIAANPTDFSDFLKDLSRPTRNAPVRVIRVPINKIEPYTGTEINLDPLAGPLILVTTGVPGNSATPGPHGFAQGQVVTINNYAGPAIRVADDIGNAQSFSLNGTNGYVWYLNADQFVYQVGPSYSLDSSNNRHAYRMLDTFTDPYPACYIEMQAGGGMPLADLVLLSNLTSTNFYANMSISCTDACLTAFAAYLGKNLAPGLKLRVAYSNETWNFSGPPPYQYVSRASHALYGGSYEDETIATCEGSLHFWSVMEAAWVSAGRSLSDFVRVMESQHVDTGRTTRRAAYCAGRTVNGVAAPIVFHELAIAPYLGNHPAFVKSPQPEAGFAAVIDRMTAAQQLDMWEIHTTYGGYEYEFPFHQNAVRAYLPNVNVITYEGGPDAMILPGGSNINYYALNHAIIRHPRWYGILSHIFRVYGESGCKAFHLFSESGTDTVASGNWAAYIGTAQRAYAPGSPAQDALQINTPDRQDLVESVTGGAVKAWASKYMAHATPPPPQLPPIRTGPRPFVPPRRYRPAR